MEFLDIGIYTTLSYLFICIALGFIGAGKIKNLREFAVGYKQISTGVLVSTIYATHLGVSSTLGLIEQINNIGIICAIIGLVAVLKWKVMRFIFCDRINQFQGCFSQAHIMERLYGDVGLAATNFVNIVSSICTVAIQIVVIGMLAEYFLDIPKDKGVIIGAAILTLYAASGGVKAVILTDFVQAVLFAIAIFSMFIFSVNKLIEYPKFLELLPEKKMWIVPTDWHSFLTLMGIIMLAIVNPFGYEAPFVQRMFISGKSKQLTRAFSYVAFIDFCTTLVISGIGILFLVQTGNGELERSQIFDLIRGDTNIFIIMAAIGLLAVSMSTADSWLNSGAVIITHSMIKVFKLKSISDIQQVTIARLMTILIGALSTLIVIYNDSIMSILLFAFSFTDPIILIPMTAGFLGYRFEISEFKRAMLCAITGVLIGGIVENKFAFISAFLGLFGSLLGLIWKRKWTFKTYDNILDFNINRPIGLSFFFLCIIIAAIYALVHAYIDTNWLNFEVLIYLSMILGLFSMLYIMYFPKTYKYDTPYKISYFITIVTLMCSIAAFTFRIQNFLCTYYLIFAIIMMLIHKAYTPALCGIVLSLVSIPSHYIQFYTSTISLTMLMMGLMFLALLCAYMILIDHATSTKEEKVMLITDMLTGLYNRRYIEEELMNVVEHAMSSGENFSVIMIEVHNFEIINSANQGHHAGDRILKLIALLIKDSIRKSDAPIRIANDKFMIVMPNTSIEKAECVAMRIKSGTYELNYSTDLQDILKSLELSVSMGVTNLSKTDTFEAFLARADSCLYQAKSSEHNNTIYTLFC